MIQTTVKPVLIRTEQIDALRKIQEQERAKSFLDIAPTIHVLARGLLDKALIQLAQES